MKTVRRSVTVDLVRRANRAIIEGKVYAPHIEAAARLPRLSAEEINKAWAKAVLETPEKHRQGEKYAKSCLGKTEGHDSLYR